jgi:crotonobetainyl-CoA:carnitine CoA-transferase CaiB-like acyl-CoA transferase
MSDIDMDKLPFDEYCRKVFDKDELYFKPEALKGYRGLSCTMYILGPSAAAYLAELGAEVIKLEVPRMGEPMRHCAPFNEPWFYPVSRWNPGRGTSPAFQGANNNEYFCTIDYRKEEARELFYSLVRKSDFMFWNYRPRTFDRWNIGYGACKEVNPRIVLCWMGGFGGFGPGRNWASYDILGQAKGGPFSITGLQAGMPCGFPSKHTTWIMDYSQGIAASSFTMAMMYWRDVAGSGVGNFGEVSQVHGATRMTEYALPLWGRHGIVRMRWGNWDTELCVNGIIQCGKSSYPNSENVQELERGYIVVQAYTDADFAKLCDIMGRADLKAKYPNLEGRVEARSQEEIYPAMEEWAADKTKEVVESILNQAGINNQPVWNAKETAEQKHWLDRGALFYYDDPYYGEVFTQGPIYKMSDTPPRVKWVHRPVGADNEDVYQRLLGVPLDKIEDLEKRELI